MSETMRSRLRDFPVFEDLDPPGFRAEDLPENPLRAVGEWLLAAAAAGQPEPHAMTLCTVADDGTPSSRVLICKDIDDGQVFFATRSDSRKGLEIARNPRVALQFHWPAVARQVRITGRAADAGRALSERDFAERGRGAQLCAHLHRTGPAAGRAEVVDEYRRISAAHPGKVPCPPAWTLYGVRPTEVELWEASPDRLHTRVRYRHGADGWTREHIWP
ncbi:pyridoxal 5'-phosphate synthase [Streptomyces sp. NPDC059637]|uniref:pyridoxine/pyridoxamine 5'-phosphate oxidase n=1 Tax=Streptomyces TaxID=1883 RepID=UPI0031DBBB6F